MAKFVSGGQILILTPVRMCWEIEGKIHAAQPSSEPAFLGGPSFPPDISVLTSTLVLLCTWTYHALEEKHNEQMNRLMATGVKGYQGTIDVLQFLSAQRPCLGKPSGEWGKTPKNTQKQEPVYSDLWSVTSFDFFGHGPQNTFDLQQNTKPNIYNLKNVFQKNHTYSKNKGLVCHLWDAVVAGVCILCICSMKESETPRDFSLIVNM